MRERASQQPVEDSIPSHRREGLDTAAGRRGETPWAALPSVVISIPAASPPGVPDAVWSSWIEATLALTRMDAREIHPVLSAGLHGKTWRVEMALPQGTALLRVVREGSPSPAQVMEWFLEVAEALAMVHAAGSAHGHLEEHHVVVDALGDARVQGFALADPTLRLPGSGVATPPFLAKAVSERSDLQAFVRLVARVAEVLPELGFLAAALRDALETSRNGPGIDIFDLHAVIARSLKVSGAPGAPPASGSSHDSMHGTAAVGIALEGTAVAEVASSRGRRHGWWPFIAGAAGLLLALGGLAAWLGSGGGEIPVNVAVNSPPAVASTTPALAARIRFAVRESEAGHEDEAAAELEEILADPALGDPGPALALLGTIRLKQGRGFEAAGLLERALRLRPSPELYRLTALAQAAAGSGDLARVTVQEGLGRFPDAPGLAELDRQLGGTP